jgi:hypothetical protein
VEFLKANEQKLSVNFFDVTYVIPVDIDLDEANWNETVILEALKRYHAQNLCKGEE